MDIHGIGGATPIVPVTQGPQPGRAPAAPVSRETQADNAGVSRGATDGARSSPPVNSPVVGKEEANAPYWQRESSRPSEEGQNVAARRQATEQAATERGDRPGQAPGEPDARDAEALRQFRESLEKSTREVNEFVKPYSNSLSFSVDEDSGKFVVKVVDKETKEVVKQIPSEEMLKLAQSLEQLKGLLIRQKA
jgi:flagellar protein FlaG